MSSEFQLDGQTALLLRTGGATTTAHFV